MNEHIWWYAARAGGLVAWTLLAISSALGILLASRKRKGTAAAWVCNAHQGLAGLSVAFVVAHVASLVADSYVGFGPAEILVPFASTWKPGAVAWGVVALWFLIAVQVTSLLRTRMSRRSWRRVHLASHGLFVASTVHLVAAGTDASTAAVRALTVAGTITLLATAVWRAVVTRDASGSELRRREGWAVVPPDAAIVRTR